MLVNRVFGGGPPTSAYAKGPSVRSTRSKRPSKRTSVLLGRPAHRELDPGRRRRDVDVVGEARADGEPQEEVAVQLGQVGRDLRRALARRVVVGRTEGRGGRA